LNASNYIPRAAKDSLPVLIGVKSDRIEAVWPEIEELVIRGLEHCQGCYWPEDVKAALIRRDMQLHVAQSDRIEAICITELVNYPRRKLCNLFLLAGENMARWVHYQSEIVAWARSVGCDGMEVHHGRAGWGKRLPGWAQSVTLRRDL
jgi:hypothetical protein